MKKKLLFVLAPLGVIICNMILTVCSGVLFTSVFNERIDLIETFVRYGGDRFFQLFCFFITYLLTGKLLKKRKVLLLSYILFLTSIFLISFVFTNSIKFSLYLSLTAVFGLVFGLAGALVYDWYIKTKREKELKRQHVKSELALLKNQISPHFLFNTLNNIDSLIKSDPDKASFVLVELGEMLRYMLYENNSERVPLEKEISYIRQYIELQQIQFVNQQLVKFEVSGDPSGKMIAPMLFIPFVENAFKHCTDKEQENAISFRLGITNEKLVFEATNICRREETISKDKASGIGLETVKRRLKLLYPGKYELVITEENNLFRVRLNVVWND